MCVFFNFSQIDSSFPAYTIHQLQPVRTAIVTTVNIILLLSCHNNETIFGGPSSPQTDHRTDRNNHLLRSLRTRGRRYHEVHALWMDNISRSWVRALLLCHLHIVTGAFLPRRSEYKPHYSAKNHTVAVYLVLTHSPLYLHTIPK